MMSMSKALFPSSSAGNRIMIRNDDSDFCTACGTVGIAVMAKATTSNKIMTKDFTACTIRQLLNRAVNANKNNTQPGARSGDNS
jgi:hypothetical protein